MEHFWDDHHQHGAGPPGMYQQPQYILVDEHDQWPVHTGLPAPTALEPLPALPPVGGRPPGKPQLMQQMQAGGGQQPGDDDEATESEDDERPLPRRPAPQGWQQQPPAGARRPDSVLTSASAQPSPTPSGSVAAPPAPAAPAHRVSHKAGASSGAAAKPRRPGGKGGVTLRLLIEEGVLAPGHNVLSVVSDQYQCGSLLECGSVGAVLRCAAGCGYDCCAALGGGVLDRALAVQQRELLLLVRLLVH